ncbi:MAG: DUF4864 domain-containing protein [Alphaproteobacteria bacterium]
MRFLLLVLALLAWPLSVSAQGPGGGDAAAIRSVIERQLEAFQRDDATAAFAFAAPGIQARFGTPEAFMDMVKRAYQPVYRPREREFRALTTGEEGPVQKVLLVGPDGRLVLALYSMEREADGSWRIAGCVLVEAEERTS